jgi:hypothetical protein
LDTTAIPPWPAPTDQRLFLEGPAGTGKTTRAIGYLMRLLAEGVPPERILVLVPQITLGRPYRRVLYEFDFYGGDVQIQTLAGLAQRDVEAFWPLVAAPAGFATPRQEPVYLNVETAQYLMGQFVFPVHQDGKFDPARIPLARAISQTLDNLTRAAITRKTPDDVAQKLTDAWGGRASNRPPVYKLTAELAKQFRAYCLANNLLDVSLVLEVYANWLLNNPEYQQYIINRYDYVIADNVEEDNPITHDLLAGLLDNNIRGALIVYDTDGGYRNFLGADPDHAYDLRPYCQNGDQPPAYAESVVMSPALQNLAYAVHQRLAPVFNPLLEPAVKVDPRQAFTFEFSRFYPQMLDWVAAQVVDLVKRGVPQREIVILAPFLSDSLRFSMVNKLQQQAQAQEVELRTLSHRPSRALKDEPATRAMLTLVHLAHPHWGLPMPPASDVADALHMVIGGLDPVRADLLTKIVYKRRDGLLSAFALIETHKQTRITYLVGQRYDGLRAWLENYKAQTEHDSPVPLDHFMRRLFGEILSQSGYGFYGDLEAGRVIAQLIDSVRDFRRALYPGLGQDWERVGKEYLTLVNQRLLSALHAQSWQDEESDGIFIAPASTFLLRNRFVDYQFWLDVGSLSWSERIEQPLTHPYVLRRTYPDKQVWTEDNEEESARGALYRIASGLVRRCRKHIYMGIADLGESGYEQRGLLLRTLQNILGNFASGQNNPGRDPNQE